MDRQIRSAAVEPNRRGINVRDLWDPEQEAKVARNKQDDWLNLFYDVVNAKRKENKSHTIRNMVTTHRLGYCSNCRSVEQNKEAHKKK